jgi:hypothetical protein
MVCGESGAAPLAPATPARTLRQHRLPTHRPLALTAYSAAPPVPKIRRPEQTLPPLQPPRDPINTKSQRHRAAERQLTTKFTKITKTTNGAEKSIIVPSSPSLVVFVFFVVNLFRLRVSASLCLCVKPSDPATPAAARSPPTASRTDQPPPAAPAKARPGSLADTPKSPRQPLPPPREPASGLGPP